MPFFVFYPLLMALFGLNALPLIAIGLVFARRRMVLSTLAGLDRVPRVLRKVARVHGCRALQDGVADHAAFAPRRICSRG